MALKRKAQHVHPSRQDQVPVEPAPKRAKRHTADGKPFKKKAHPVNELKSQIRSLKRLLSRNEKLPADVRVEKERALQTAQRELDNASKGQALSDMIGKYHKIRFFDRKTATRRLKRAQKDLDALEESSEAGKERELLVKRVEDAKVDVNYAQYYPLDRPYVSLFPRKKSVPGDKGAEGDEEDVDQANMPSGTDATQREREGDLQMWQQIEQSMAEGTLDALRNGKLLPLNPPRKELEKDGVADHIHRGKPAAKPYREAEVDKGGPALKDDDADDSDGGFFE